MNWREKIEAQIAELANIADDEYEGYASPRQCGNAAVVMQALYDVAVAGLAVYRELDGQGIESVYALEEKLMSLDKLREVGDGRSHR